MVVPRAGAQLEPWFLTLNPAGTLPVLVRTADGAEAVKRDWRDIVHFVDSAVPEVRPPRRAPR